LQSRRRLRELTLKKGHNHLFLLKNTDNKKTNEADNGKN